MENMEYWYSVKALVKMTRSEIEHAILMSQTHYDSICRQAGEAGPGFLYAYKNRLEDGQNESQQPLGFRELDILNKVLEAPGSDPKLKDKVVSILLALRDEESRVNNEQS